MKIIHVLIIVLVVILGLIALTSLVPEVSASQATAVAGFVDSATSCYWIGNVMYCN